jgi:CubicO group peptidase (beta-lactamase class C family)
MTYAACANMTYHEAWAEFGYGKTYVNEVSGSKVPAFFSMAGSGADPVLFPTTAEPGQYFFYSAAQWQFLGVIIEKLTSLSYEDAIKKYISKPLGIAPPALEGASSYGGAHADPGGGLLGTAEAFGKVLGAYLSGDLLSKSTKDIMETPWTLKIYDEPSKSLGYMEATTHHSGKSTYVGYALGMWVDCDTSDCSSPAVYHSIGGRGFLPVIDRKNNYWAVLARASDPLAADMSNLADVLPFGTAFSIPFFGTLAPMIDQLYSDEATNFDMSDCPAAC